MLLPLSKIIVGTSIGTNAAIVPLAIGIAPYLAKMLESAFKEVDHGIIEAAKSYGASNTQIIFKVIFNESLPNIISGITLTLIFTIGFRPLQELSVVADLEMWRFAMVMNALIKKS